MNQRWSRSRLPLSRFIPMIGFALLLGCAPISDPLPTPSPADVPRERAKREQDEREQDEQESLTTRME